MLAERLGFDSVWLRDHVAFRPHTHESQDPTFLEMFLVMSAIVSVTTRVAVGSAALIPFRSPIHTALLLASLDRLSGPGRVISGWGLGRYDYEFDAVNMGTWDRRAVVHEQMSIVRRLLSGETVRHQGRYYRFEAIRLNPVPPSGSVQFFYCGSSRAAVRRAVELFDGWGPVRKPRFELSRYVHMLRTISGSAGRPVPKLAVSAMASPARTVEEGVRKADLPKLLVDANHLFDPRPDGRKFETAADFDGALVAGPSDVIAEEVRLYERLGADHFIFDLRHRFADWDECVQQLGEEVLPRLRAQAVA